jgi:hypothetical protein
LVKLFEAFSFFVSLHSIIYETDENVLQFVIALRKKFLIYR